MSDSLIGKQLGDYQIRELLGRGGMARVYIGYDARLDRQAAVKVINSDFSPEDRTEYYERFQREARAIARLNHPNIVGVYQFGQYEDSYYMAMVFVEGRDLRQILREYHDRRETPPLSDAINVARGIGSALDYAHSRGVIHRDVKPSNIMLTRDTRAILTDFGLALTSAEGTRGETFGSAHYIAPEQAVSSAKAVPQSDLYSLGVCLYEMLTGQVPFDDPSAMTVALKHLQDPPPPPRTINPKLSTAVEHVLLRALDKDPARRYPSGADLTRALESAVENEQLSDTAQIEIALVRASAHSRSAPEESPLAKPQAKTPGAPPPYSPPPSLPPMPPPAAIPTTVGGPADSKITPPRPDTTQAPVPTQKIEAAAPPRRPAIGQLIALLVIVAILGGGYLVARNAKLIPVNVGAANTPDPTPGSAVQATSDTASSQTVQALTATTGSINAALFATGTVAAPNPPNPPPSDVPPGTAFATFSPIILSSPAATQSVGGTSTLLVSAAATNPPTIVSGTASATATTTRADVMLVYDQGQLDLINLTSEPLSMINMTFTQKDTGRRFDVWQTWVSKPSDTLASQRCYQVYRIIAYSVEPALLGDCLSHRAAFWASAEAHVFWVAPSGLPGTPTTTPPTTFTVSIGSQIVTTCQVIAADSGANGGQTSNQCPFSLPTSLPS